ncbi:MAG TPA: hypothetical protein DCG28_03740 [Lachnospiraceae bacterium]|nr:hypothetical protein [Lachnospiraceae bacterium]
MYCKNCGNKADDTAPFCSHCGKPLNDEILESGAPYSQNGQAPQLPYMHQPYIPQNPYTQIYGQPYQQIPPIPPYIQPTILNFQQPQPIVPTANGTCTAAFICGLVGFFIMPWIFGIVAIICGIVGIVNFDAVRHNNKWQGITGLVLGIINILWAILVYAYILDVITKAFSSM